MTSSFFWNEQYQRHNQRRLEHLASLKLPIAGKAVLELGAGVGDHSSFFIDRGCSVRITDARPDNLEAVRVRFPEVITSVLDIDQQVPPDLAGHDIVYAYGLLYHCSNPSGALARMASMTDEMLLLETCVAFGDGKEINEVREDNTNPTQSIHGRGCRPTRSWVFSQLQSYFSYVYNTLTQPWHEEFPLDWRGHAPSNSTGLYRNIFVAARRPLINPCLSDQLVDLQQRH